MNKLFLNFLKFIYFRKKFELFLAYFNLRFFYLMFINKFWLDEFYFLKKNFSSNTINYNLFFSVNYYIYLNYLNQDKLKFDLKKKKERNRLMFEGYDYKFNINEDRHKIQKSYQINFTSDKINSENLINFNLLKLRFLEKKKFKKIIKNNFADNGFIFNPVIDFNFFYYNFYLSSLFSFFNKKKKFFIFIKKKRLFFLNNRANKKSNFLKSYFCYFKLSKNNLFFTLTDSFGRVIFNYSGRTHLDIYLNTKISNATYFTLPRFAARVKYEIYPNNSIEKFFLSKEILTESKTIISVFKKKKLTVSEIINWKSKTHNSFFKKKKLAKKKRLK